MERAERSAIYMFAFGGGVALLALAGPFVFPHAPLLVWQSVFVIGIIVIVFCGVRLWYEYREFINKFDKWVFRALEFIALIFLCSLGFASLNIFLNQPRTVSVDLPAHSPSQPSKQESKDPNDVFRGEHFSNREKDDMITHLKNIKTTIFDKNREINNIYKKYFLPATNVPNLLHQGVGDIPTCEDKERATEQISNINGLVPKDLIPFSPGWTNETVGLTSPDVFIEYKLNQSARALATDLGILCPHRDIDINELQGLNTLGDRINEYNLWAQQTEGAIDARIEYIRKM